MARAQRPKRSHADDLRGAAQLAIQATTAVTRVVEEMHRTIAGGPAILGAPMARPVRTLTGIAYGGVRGVTRLIGGILDDSLAQLAPLLGASESGPQREAFLAVLNGVIGDHLAETGSALATPMTLRRGDRTLKLDRASLARAYPKAKPKLLVLIHGSSLGSLQWTRHGHNHGDALARDLGYSAVSVNYNSGLHVSTNGRALAAMLEVLVQAWPVPVDEIAILGHSMGGLVARSAAHYGARRSWRSKLKQLVTLGTPHEGAPLERGGARFELLMGLSRYSAPLGRLGHLRSAGVTDLRYGNVIDEHWAGSDRFALGPDSRKPVPLPRGVGCFAIAGTTASGKKEMPRNNLPGDGLVPVHSALGEHGSRAQTLAFRKDHQWVAFGTSHLDLLSRPEVYERLRDWLRA